MRAHGAAIPDSTWSILSSYFPTWFSHIVGNPDCFSMLDFYSGVMTKGPVSVCSLLYEKLFFSSFYLVCYFWNCIKTLWKFYGLMLGLLYGLYTYFYFHVCKWWEDFIVWWPMHSWTRLLVRDQLRPSVAAQLAAVLQERILELSKAVKMMEVEGLSLSSKFCV